MGQWTNLIIVAHVLIALAIIGLVLLQHGKGADMGSGFGGGASSSLFGATGSANFLSRATAALATVFFLTSLGLAYLASEKPRSEAGTVMDAVKPQPPAAPAAGDIPKPQALPPAGGDSGSQAPGVPK
ncbi:MAG: preprotein translocase subunit SecG [Betaproteobacteria bacterium]|nr:preprotein translocase subunit SecG [Betaproteobacteria bacterium]MDH4323149.1 preprotein translocase subunit SecG [Betaproteobacteria bacterium]MDH5211465.1 preprotein translocase subunit SecG [Betaproteobacteria bacterium]MDH5579281.1 preprotein translocase subunit SecG [Betaproteobacteria bacterium]